MAAQRGKGGINPLTVKEALLASDNSPTLTSAITGNAPRPVDAAEIGSLTQGARTSLAAKATGIAAPLADGDTPLGEAFARAHANSLNNINGLYAATRGFKGTMQPGFASGLMDTINDAVDTDAGASGAGEGLASKIADAPTTYAQTQAAIAKIQSAIADADAAGEPITPGKLANIRTELSTLRGMARNGSDTHALGVITKAFDEYRANAFSNGQLLGEDGATVPGSENLGQAINDASQAYQDHTGTFSSTSDAVSKTLNRAVKAMPQPEFDDNGNLVPGSGGFGTAQDTLVKSIVNPRNLATSSDGLAVYNKLTGRYGVPGVLDDEGVAALNTQLRQLVTRTDGNGMLAMKPDDILNFLQSPIGQKIFSAEERGELSRIALQEKLFTARPIRGTGTNAALHTIAGNTARSLIGGGIGMALGDHPFLGGTVGVAGERLIGDAVERALSPSVTAGVPVSAGSRLLGAAARRVGQLGNSAMLGHINQNAQPPAQTPYANGGRTGRKAGGRAPKFDHAARAASLVRAAEQAKKAHGKATEPLLGLPDEAITKALAIANRHV